ncbi:phage major capsid protein [Echinicola shivajiensis]|uniref:phage major capsid protein n=1 Tax=Echinicola shivajiensis TaxID=1035916 RepID=UPI001BFC3F77|nr:phage major capsid protein [Echinicola shivajiensis]
MKKSVELRKKLADLDNEIKQLLDSAKQENRDFNKDEKESFDSKFAEAEELRNDIAQAEKVEAFEARQASEAGKSVPSIQTRSKEKYSIIGHINAVRSGKLDGIYGEAQSQGEKEVRDSGVSPNANAVYIPANYQRDFSVTGDSGAKGGNLVATEKGGIIESLFEGSLLNKVGASSMLGLVSNVDLPKGNSVTSSWVGENASVSASDHEIGNVELRPNRLATRMNVSNQLFIQSSESVEAYLRNEIEKSIQKALDEKFITDLLASSDVNAIVGDVNGKAIDYDGIMSYISTVGKSEADMANAKFLINWDVYGALKQLKKGTSNERFVLEDDKIEGFDYVVSNRIPSDLTKGTGTDLSAAAFGDFTNTIVAGWSTVEILIDPYTQAGSGKTVLNVGSYFDIKNKYPEALAVQKDIIA